MADRRILKIKPSPDHVKHKDVGDETSNPLPDDYVEKPKPEPEAGDDSLEDCDHGGDERRD